MAQAEGEMLAACGLDCGPCSIRRIPFDADAAEDAIRWFRQMGWLEESEGVAEAVQRRMTCRGCQGDRTVHWSADCGILLCCVDERNLSHCGECAESMSCGKLEAFANDGQAHHKAAVMSLRRRFGSTDL
jgi:hypothetical protein